MDWGAIVAGALGGGATQVADIADKQINEKSKFELLREQQRLELEKEQAAEQRKVAAQKAERAASVADVQAGAQGVVNRNMASHPVETFPTWTPEQEAVRQQGMAEMATRPETMVQGALEKGRYTEAAAIDKINESGVKTLAPFAQLRRADGTLIAENDGYARSQADLEKTRAQAAGKASKVLDPVIREKAINEVVTKAAIPSNPYNTELPSNGKQAEDPVGRNAFAQLLDKNLTDDGSNMREAKTVALQQLTAIDKATRARVEKDFGGMYDAKGRWDGNNESAQRIEARYGFNPKTVDLATAKSQARRVGYEMAVAEVTATDDAPAAPRPTAAPAAQAASAPAPKPSAPAQAAPAAPATAPDKKVWDEEANKRELEPKGPKEFQLAERARGMGFYPVGRGNALFGEGELLFKNPKTGETKWASKL